MKIIFTLLVLLANLIYADMETADVTLPAECEPICSVADCVNVSTGSFFHVDVDFVGNTIDPLYIERVYDSSCTTETFLGMGFGCQIPFIASSIELGSRHSYAQISERDGFLMQYRGNKSESKAKCVIDPRILTKGFTNLSKSSNSHVNFVNWSANFEKSLWKVKKGDGSKWTYGKKVKVKSIRDDVPYPSDEIYLLTESTKPNGNKIKYEYTTVKKKPYLSKMFTENRAGKVFNVVVFDYTNTRTRLQSSCGNTVEYNYCTTKDCRKNLTNSVYSTQYAPSIYGHIKSDLNTITKPNGQFLKVKYRKDKVEKLKGPGPDGNTICKYKFVYDKDKTDVVDALGYVKTYNFDSKKRLKSIG